MVVDVIFSLEFFTGSDLNVVVGSIPYRNLEGSGGMIAPNETFIPD